MNVTAKKLPALLLALALVAGVAYAETVTLLDGVTSNSNGPSTVWPLRTPYKCANIIVYGTWDTATVTLQHSLDNGTTWMDFKDDTGTSVTWTANAEKVLCIDQRMIRLVVSSVGGSTDLDARIGG